VSRVPDRASQAGSEPRPAGRHHLGNLALRVISALIMAPIALGAAWLGSWVFAVFWLAAALLVLWEWIHLVAGPRHILMFSASASALVVAALVAAAVLGIAGPASAHNQVIATTPASGATLTALPAQFSITTNLPMLDINGTGNGFALQIRSADGRYYGDGCLKIVDATMSEKAAIGPAGDYTVLWQLISQDGHTVSGSYPFSWQPPAGFTPSRSYAAPQECGRVGTASTAAPGNPDAARSSTAPLADVLWIGGALAAVAIAVVVAILVLGRRRKEGA